MQEQLNIAEVILPVPLPGYFSYLVPPLLREAVVPGIRVVVPFGKKRLLAGLVRRILPETQTDMTLKEVLAVLDDRPVIREIHFLFWEWMARYYLCTPGEVMVAALPASFRLESETAISINPAFNGDMSRLTDKEYLIIEALQFSESLSISQICDIVDQKKVMNLIQGLIDKEVVISSESIAESYRPKSQTRVRLCKGYHEDEPLKELLDELGKRAFRQLELMMCFLQVAGGDVCSASMAKADLLGKAGAGPAALKALTDKKILEEFQVEVSRLGHYDATKHVDQIVFNAEQQEALAGIREGIDQGKPVLLHGVTGSGKTEIYIRLIHEMITAGKQVLYILPEIALTSQIINRLRDFFGDRVQVYHSRYSDRERTELWNKVIQFAGEDNDPWVIVGARSALFVPLTDAGLVIVDEEHDHSFKQFDPAPRYQGRDAAIMLASQLGIPVLLGSATPAMESMYNAVSGKYHLVQLPVRYGKSVLPEILIADVAEARRRKELKSHYTPLLLQHIEKALKAGMQIILFQNRRGFSLRLVCEQCGWHPGCPHCDVTLTYHKFIDRLKCHYCGYLRKIPSKCDECTSPEIRTTGFGTEKIEEEIRIFFPKARLQRMDFDTTRTRTAYQSIIEDFEAQKIDILIGTQMVTKGLDFSHVAVVGIMDADSMIAFPDFRSFERSFQHILQVSGRAGRQATRGIVVIQTGRPSHEVIRLAKAHDYMGLYNLQITERSHYSYPPFTRLIRIVCKSKQTSALNETSYRLADDLRAKLGSAVLGPEYPLVSRIKDEYLRHILIKLIPDKYLTAKKQWILEQVLKQQSAQRSGKVRLIIDVDPY